MAHNPEHDALRWAVTDHIFDRLEAEGIDPFKVLSDEFWDWWDETIEKPVLALVCEVDGHSPTRDHCGRPEHDHCAVCMTPMPGSAVT